MYFTYVHIIFIVLLVAIFSATGFLIVIKQKNTKNIALIISGLIVSCLGLCVLSCLLLDEYLKVAKISNVKYTRVLMNESMQISAIITNVGNFDISSCTLSVRLANRPAKLDNIKAEYFEQKGGFWENFFRKRKTFEVSAVKEEFTIGENLVAKSARPFSVFVRYPTTFTEPKITYNLSCR